MNIIRLEEKIKKLPPNIQNEIENFVDYLYEKQFKGIPKKELSFSWENGLEELKGKYTSIELQHKLLEWR